ncbi:MAG: hypothetical protein WCF07_14190 [Nitrososphaeraceae archaeon]
MVPAIKYPLMERKTVSSVKYTPNEYGRLKKVIKSAPNLTLDEMIGRFKIMRIEDPKSA